MDNIFIGCFDSITDPRVERAKKHLLLDILTLALCGVLAGAETWEEIEDFGKEQNEWFSSFSVTPAN